jgi:hypothetical protein
VNILKRGAVQAVNPADSLLTFAKLVAQRLVVILTVSGRCRQIAGNLLQLVWLRVHQCKSLRIVENCIGQVAGEIRFPYIQKVK